MIWGKFDRLSKVVFPILQGLTGSTKEEVEIDRIKPCIADPLECLECFLHWVLAPKSIHKFWIEGLHTHGDAVDAMPPQNLEFFGCDFRGSKFDRPLSISFQFQVIN